MEVVAEVVPLCVWGANTCRYFPAGFSLQA